MRRVVVGWRSCRPVLRDGLGTPRAWVVLVDRDSPPPPVPAEWNRRGVTQFLTPHFFRFIVLTIGGLENGLRFDALAKEGAALAAAQANLSFASVDGAEHSYMSRIPEVWALTSTWLESTKPRT